MKFYTAEDIPKHWKYGISWNDRFKKELPHLSRDCTRIILGLRTGHNHLRHYLHERLHVVPDSNCYCGAHGQDFYHLLTHCGDRSTQAMSAQLRRKTLDTYWRAWVWIKEHEERTPKWNFREMDYDDPHTFLFPPRDMPMHFQKEILHATANLYRHARGYLKQREAARIRKARTDSTDKDRSTNGTTSGTTNSTTVSIRAGIG